MTVKKRLFISNTAIVLAALVMLMAVMLTMLKLAEKTYMSRFDDLRQITVTDKNGETLVFNNEHSHESESEILTQYKKEITSLFILFTSVGVTAMVFILLLSNAFTKIMLRSIMKPAETDLKSQ